jgi:hypothetical protein
MLGKWLFVCGTAALLAGDVLARGTAETPSAEMIEFLATYDPEAGEDNLPPIQERDPRMVPGDTLMKRRQ